MCIWGVRQKYAGALDGRTEMPCDGRTEMPCEQRTTTSPLDRLTVDFDSSGACRALPIVKAATKHRAGAALERQPRKGLLLSIPVDSHVFG